MKKYLFQLIIISLSFIVPTISFAQNPEGFDKMAKEMADKTVPIIKTNQVVKLMAKSKEVIFLDAREKSEYKISHIKNAVFIGYDNFKKENVSSIDKNATIVVYCSVGYRSGKIGKQLREMGYTSVFNLYGGLFDWANNGNPVYSNYVEVQKVHPYNATWGAWLKPELRSK